MALLEIRNLSVTFATARGPFRAVDGIDLTVEEGDLIGVVGESGSGKSVTMLALMGLLPWTATVKADRLSFDGADLLTLKPEARRKLVGKDVAMIFQEPMTSLNPCFTVGFQIIEAMQTHLGGSKRVLKARAVELMNLVGIPDPERRLASFPHQMSGGMNQRVMIAMALSCNPRLLIADEPTTALDVTIQAQILDLLVRLQRERRMALILITHDMGVIAETAEQVNVMYAGQQVDTRPVERLFAAPRHPYAAALLSALPARSFGKARLATIPGVVPGVGDRPPGCLFAPRCPFVEPRCEAAMPQLMPDGDGRVRCYRPLVGGLPEDGRGATRPELLAAEAPALEASA